MQKLLFLVVVYLCCAFLVSCDEASDLKLNKQKLAEAKQILEGVNTKMKSSYIQNFAAILAKGVADLETRTEAELKKTTDPVQRHNIIDFATKAYDRLIKFITEIEENMTNINGQ